MQEKNMKIAAISVSLLGILLLLFISEKIEPKKINISDINQNNLNQYVKINANITKLKYTPKILITTIQDNTSNITMIAYTNKTYIKKGQQIQVIGKIKKYKQELEIIAEQIKII